MRFSVPAITWLRAYRRDSLRHDLAAGITLAAYLLPAGLGDASLAGLPPEAGLVRGPPERAHHRQLAEEFAAMGIQVQVVEARSSVRERLRGEGLGGKLGGVDRFTSVADVVDRFRRTA
jgi:MFS superfamily sulfate permease-like transporter